MMAKWLSLSLGSLAGGLARYAVAGASYRVLGTDFPHGTMVVRDGGWRLATFHCVMA